MKLYILIICLGLLFVASVCAAAGMTISDAKLLPDNSSVSLSAKVVTYAGADFFYIEEDSRCMGIKVEKTSHGLTVGMRADVTGTMKVNTNRERYILATSAVQTAPPNANGTLAPISLNNSALGGGAWRVAGTGGQKGVSNSVGLNNIGLLVKTWGQFQQIDATTFTLDDGAGLCVKCTVPSGTTLSSDWQQVAVTGISSIYMLNSTTYPPMLLIRDIQLLKSQSPGLREMIYIPAGSFLMGNNGSEPCSISNELPQHSVTLSDYYIGKYEVTRGEYREFMNAGGYTNSAYWSADGWSWKSSRTEPGGWAASQDWGTGAFTQTDNCPVVGVSYYEAEAFCNWAGGHLPTEAQWEKAARWNAATSHPNIYPWGDTWDLQKCNNLYDTLYPGYQTAPVGSYPLGSSPYGCQDMAGNIWEWCQDWYGSNYYSQPPVGGWSDPQGPISGSSRVLRGGCWNNAVSDTRCAFRHLHYPYNYDYGCGFRLARDLPLLDTVSVPGTPSGNTIPVVNANETYATTGSTCNLDHTVEYSFNWGDGTSSPWSTSTSASHVWSTTGTKTVTVTARCQDHTSVAATSNALAVTASEMIYIPSGWFQMGNNGSEPFSYSNEFPQHFVYLSDYYIGKYEVTRGEYRAFMNAGGYTNSSYWSTDGWSWKVSNSRTEPTCWAAEQESWMGWQPFPFTQTDNHPVVGVSYYEAEAFCNWAGGQLPSEAQWEKAARWNAATNHPNVFPWGDVWDYEKCTNNMYPFCHTTPVGSYPNGASPYGCQDMAGNVWEWCQDWYKSYPESTDPVDYTGSYRVLRGGGWYYLGPDHSDEYRCSLRGCSYPNNGYYYYDYYDYGFRLSRMSQPVEIVFLPGTLSGNTIPVVNTTETYTTYGSTSNKKFTIEYSFNWGDGTSSPWSTSTSASHSWSTLGTRTVTVTARCQENTSIAATSAGLTVDMLNPSPYTGQMIYIPAGSFLMGNSDVGDDLYCDGLCITYLEKPQHSVNLTGYYMGKYEVTRGEYRAFMNAGGYINASYWSADGWSWKVSNSRTEPTYWAANQDWGTGMFTQTDNYPVYGVTYYEATAFCNWAGGHLPSEEQWEKAARWNASTSHPNIYPWGDTWDAEKCNNYADSNASGGGYQRYQTAPVGSYPSGASPYGCQDMAGNVCEWCQGDYVGYHSLRGGSSYDSNCNLRCANRYGRLAEDGYFGFRLAR